MADNQKISENIQALETAQEADQDNRDKVREASLFLNKRDGQWDPYTVSKMGDKPKYTFDMCNPILDDVMGEMESMDFGIKVRPTGGEASKETAEQYAGIIRNVENISGARYTYKDAARVMTGTGLGGWRVVTRFRDSDSIQQDLLIDPLQNFKDRVWYDSGAQLRTMEDAKECWVLTTMPIKDYEKMFPKGSRMSVGDDRRANAYWQRDMDNVVIGEWLYKRTEDRELALLSNNKIVVVDDDFDKVRDELFRTGVTVDRTRKRKVDTVYQRLFDGADWLTESKKTVFEFLPVVPIYANYAYDENKVTYWGMVEKLMDPQRVLNFAESRKIEEAALSPREKTWMTKDQAQSPDVRNTLRTANTNMDSHQLYDYNEGQPPPHRQPKQQPNTVLLETASTAERYMSRTMPDESKGQSTPGRSGLAMGQLVNKGDNSNYKYFTATEIGIAHTCRILIKAIPKVHDTRQEMQLLGQDGTVDTITIKDVVIDEQTGQQVEINDLSKGSYSVACSSGPAFTNRQQETVQAIIDIAGIAPQVADQGADILVNNVDSPGMDLLAERIRLQKVMSGQIPESQLTDDEKEMISQQSQQNQEPTAVDQALMAEAQARTKEVEAKTADTISKMQERQNKAERELEKLEQKNTEMLLRHQDSREDLELKQNDQLLKVIESKTEQINTMAQTLKTLREAQGVEAAVGPATVKSYINQAEAIVDRQEAETVPGEPGVVVTRAESRGE